MRVLPALFIALHACGAMALNTAIANNPVKLPDCENLGPPSNPLPLMEAVTRALCHNPDTRVTWAQALSQEAAVGISRASYYPTATLNDLYTDERTTLNYLPKPVHTLENEPSVTLQYLIYDFGGRAAGLDAAEHSALSSVFSYGSSVQQVVLNTVQAYYGLQSANASIDAEVQTLAFNKATLAVADSKHTLGVAPISDKLQAETSVAQTELNIEALRQQAAVGYGTLLRAMGVAPQTQVAIPKEVRAFFEDKVTETALDQMMQEALQHRPDLVAAKEAEESAKAQLSKAQTLDYPTISLSATQDGINASRPDSFRERDSILELTVSIPIFTGFSNQYQRFQAQHNLEAQSATREQTEQNIAEDVWNSYQNYQTARANIGLTDTLVKAAQESYNVSFGRYKEGVGTILDVLNAQSQLATALQQQVGARYTLQTQRASLAHAMGLLYLSPQALATAKP